MLRRGGGTHKTTNKPTKTTTKHTLHNNIFKNFHAEGPNTTTTKKNSTMNVSTPPTDFDQDLEKIAVQFKEHVQLADRTYRLKTYKQVFVGSEAVDYLVESGATTTREEAVELGKVLQEMRVFEHVLRDHEFKDEHLFYRFVHASERGTYKIDEQTGQAVKWSSFLGAGTGETSEANGDDHVPWQPSLPKPDLEALNPKDVHVSSHVWPLDTFNTTLLDHVHPPEWQDPQANQKDGSSTYDLVVIGAGVGGLITAGGSAGVGARVAMIEANLLGGDW